MNKVMKRIFLLALFSLLLGATACTKTSTSNTALTPVDSFEHAHGLAVDIADSNKLLIATHDGLFLLANEQDQNKKSQQKLYRIGDMEDDLMGFSAHPTQPRTFFASGHPAKGGNLGIVQSTDGGYTWKKIANGVNGPVDFHTMAISSANPSLLYGWYDGELQKTLDGGLSWGVVETDVPTEIISLHPDPNDENTVYAVVIGGLMMSTDQGAHWTDVGEQMSNNAVIALAVNPQDPQKMVSFSRNLGLAISTDGGKTWENQPDFEKYEDIPLYLVFDPQQTNTLYALSRSNKLYKSVDHAATWTEITWA
ncbi:TPA: hypothetical protein HA297_02885 [Candidatus Woesearchaeota archaeon]|nr:hypothetical protein [Candidatus Woesearchaeota archaeon]